MNLPFRLMVGGAGGWRDRRRNQTTGRPRTRQRRRMDCEDLIEQLVIIKNRGGAGEDYTAAAGDSTINDGGRDPPRS